MFVVENGYIYRMKRQVTTFSIDRKSFSFCLIYLFSIGLVLFIQNYIRYGYYAEYTPWPTIRYLFIGFILFLLFLPGFHKLMEHIRKEYYRQFWVFVALSIGLLILIYYTFSSGLMYLLNYKDSFFSESYARFYFGRVVVFHILLLIFLSAYVFYKNKGAVAKQITGTLGRKKITIKATMARWIEADDHYLRIHLDEGIMLKRSTLDQMTKELNPEFVRIHRKYLVNKDLVIGREKNKRDEYLILTTGERLKVGRSYSPINW